MAVLSTRAVAATVAALTLRVRRLIGDTESEEANQRWSDTDIRSAIDDTLAHMYTQVASSDPSGFLQFTDLTYTASALSVTLPAGIEGQSIYKVEDIDDAALPVYLAYRSPVEINRFSDEHGWTLDVTQSAFSAGTTVSTQAIAVRPIPSAARLLRIYTLAPFIPVSAAATPTTDQHTMSLGHEELITLGSAIRLQEIDNEVPSGRRERHGELWEHYIKTAARHQGPVYVRNTRILLN